MQRRKLFMVLAAGLALPLTGYAQAGSPLRAAFMAMSERQRRTVQEELKTAGFYEGRVDGYYGPGTERALAEAAAFISENSRGEARYDLRSEAGIHAYLSDLADGTAAAWLYGEGVEADLSVSG